MQGFLYPSSGLRKNEDRDGGKVLIKGKLIRCLGELGSSVVNGPYFGLKSWPDCGRL